MGTRAGLLAVALSVASVGVVAVALGGPQAGPSDSVALASALGQTADAAQQRPYSRLNEFLPNVEHVSDLAPGSPAVTITDNVVRGSVVAVQEGKGYIETGNMPTRGRPGAVIAAYTDAAADWRSLRVTIQVDEVLAGAKDSQLSFDLTLLGNTQTGQDGAAVSRALEDLGEVITFSHATPSGPEYLGLTRTLPDKAFGLATLSDSGALAFPYAGPDAWTTSPAFMAGVDTLDKLRAELSKPTRTKKN